MNPIRHRSRRLGASVPIISGIGYVGSLLYVSNGAPGPYQWLRSGIPIVGATESHYLVTSADEGLPVRCRAGDELSNIIERWMPTDLPHTIRAWYDPADASTVAVTSGRITQITNKAGGAPDAVQATGSAQPLYSSVNGRGVIECDTFGKSLEFGSLGFDQNATWSLLYGTAPPYAYTAPVSGRVQIRGTGRFSFIRESTFPYILGQRANSSSQLAGPTLAQAAAGVAVHTHTKPATVGGDTNQITSYQDGSAASTYADSVAVTFADANANRINALSTTGNRGTCSYLDVLVVLAVLTADERERWEGYLCHKYGDTSNLPSTHRYKAVPPNP